MCDNLWPDELKILIVDDHQEVLNLIRLSLEPAGFRVLRTTKPAEGLALALAEQPDLLIIDIMMPGMDGFELLRRIRRDPRMNKVPAIVISARASNVDQRRMMELLNPATESVDAYLGKPVSPAYLLQTVKDVLTAHRDHLLKKKRLAEKVL